MWLTIINLLIFPVVPVVATASLALADEWWLIARGVVLVVGTIYGLGILHRLERRIFTRLSRSVLSYLAPAYNLALAIVSVMLCWKLLNLGFVGDWRVFLFAYVCSYYPYNYLLGAEQARTGRVNLMTNVVNNFVIVGYLIFGLLMNYFVLPEYTGYTILLLVGLYFYRGLPQRLAH